MEISGIFTALVIGLIIGALGRLVLPGRQQIGFWLTLLIGVVAALLGTFVAAIFGVANTAGIDWIELALQVAFAAGGVAAVDGIRGGRDRRAIER
ncbi:GlsB/YeaQ/YmgE family stress response membrane protein [Dactylosporangium sp. NPDC005572]|uniref:GlsB/YeaQ/YmgE family stress response membrane protein n=1 Tax=Dactylosporangium sp. NPDC005572 TaxID=3156889 RepID=UPI0033AF8382